MSSQHNSGEVVDELHKDHGVVSKCSDGKKGRGAKKAKSPPPSAKCCPLGDDSCCVPPSPSAATVGCKDERKSIERMVDEFTRKVTKQQLVACLQRVQCPDTEEHVPVPPKATKSDLIKLILDCHLRQVLKSITAPSSP